MPCGDRVADLSFRFDWLDGTGIQGSQLAATYAALEIRVGASRVTRVLDHRARAVRDRIHVPLFPLAESLASNWWFLTAESRTPTDAERLEYRQRHSLVHGGDGFLFPDLIAVPDGERVHLEWFPSPAERIENSKIEFLDRGRARTDLATFREGCSRFVESVIRRLDDSGIEGTFLHEEWSRVRGANAEESVTCETAAGLGWDPYDLDDARWKVLETLDALGAALREAVPAIVSETPESAAASGAALTQALEAARTGGGSFPDLESLRRKIEADRAFAKSGSDATPRSDGYDLARRLRRSLDLDGGPLRTEELAQALDHPAEALGARAPIDFGPATLFDGVVAANGDGRASFAFRPALEENRRFHLCRALAEALTAPAADAVLTGAPTPRQQRGRAFAAEFLAPASALRDRIRRPLLHDEDLSDLSNEFGVSTRMIEHQLENHGIAEVVRLDGARP